MTYGNAEGSSNDAEFEGQLCVDKDNGSYIKFQYSRGNTNGIPDENAMKEIFQDFIDYLEDFEHAERPEYNNGEVDENNIPVLIRARAVQAWRNWAVGQNITSYVEEEVIPQEAPEE